jgi:pyridoxal phosphate enzyme (YggS family)
MPAEQLETEGADSGAANVAARLATVRGAIAAAAEQAGRRAQDVRLVAVGKAQPVERVEAALAAGHRAFGENRVQEALGKWPALRAKYPDARVHLIGPLQTNKVGDAVSLFDAIETIDRDKLARALAKEMDRRGRRPDCFVQVNTGEEVQKTGVAPDEAAALIGVCRELGLPLVGLMCIPPAADEPSLHFALLAKIAERNGLARLSMGMSHDFEIAVTFGATDVRIGTAIFGKRGPPPL